MRATWIYLMFLDSQLWSERRAPIPQSFKHWPESAAVPNQLLQDYLQAGHDKRGERKTNQGIFPVCSGSQGPLSHSVKQKQRISPEVLSVCTCCLLSPGRPILEGIIKENSLLVLVVVSAFIYFPSPPATIYFSEIRFIDFFLVQQLPYRKYPFQLLNEKYCFLTLQLWQMYCVI